MGREPLNLADDPASDGGVEPLEAALEIGGCLYPIRIDHECNTSLPNSSSVKRNPHWIPRSN
jgi:hypothetical protein